MTSDRARERPGRLGLTLLIVCGLTVFFAGFHSIIDTDVWFHLRAGMSIAHGAIPRVDTFSYPSAGRPYIDLHWFFQLIAYLVYRLAGEPGLVWFACAVVSATFFVLYSLARREAPAPLAAALTALGALVASERFSPRPEIFTFLFLALTLWLLHRHARGDRRAWWIIPAVLLLWVNSEGLFVLGYVLIVAALLDRPDDRRLWQALGLSLLAALANPYFARGAVHPLLLFTRVNRSLPIYSATIGEFLRTPLNPFSEDALHPATALFPFYLGLLGLGIVACGRWPRRGEILRVALFTYLACSARRNVALLPIVATPILARWIARGAARPFVARWWKTRRKAWRGALVHAALLAALVSLAAYDLGLVTNRIYVDAETNREFGTGRAPDDFARGAAGFLKETGVRGPIFTTFAAGSYLTWAYPEERVFIDGRLEVHTASHYERYLRLLQVGPPWAEADREYSFNAAVIQYLDAMNLTLDRLRDPDWTLVYLDDNAVVLLKRNSANKEIIAQHTITAGKLFATYPALSAAQVDSSFVLPPPPARSPLSWFQRVHFPWSQMELGQFFFAINRSDLALAQFLEAVRRAPDEVGPRLMVASALNKLSRPRLAWDALRSAESLGGNRGMRLRALGARGDILLALGQAQEAVAAFSGVIARGPEPGQMPVLLANRALARLRAGDAEGAAGDVLESLRRAPGSAQSYWILGMVEEARGRPAEAKRAYETFQTFGGRSSEVDAALKRLGGS